MMMMICPKMSINKVTELKIMHFPPASASYVVGFFHVFFIMFLESIGDLMFSVCLMVSPFWVVAGSFTSRRRAGSILFEQHHSSFTYVFICILKYR